MFDEFLMKWEERDIMSIGQSTIDRDRDNGQMGRQTIKDRHTQTQIVRQTHKQTD